MHILPGPIPTFKQSAPTLIKSNAASLVTMLPAIRSKFGYLVLIFLISSIILVECPWAESMTSISTCAFTSSSTRSMVSISIETAAPTLSLLFKSLHALGKSSLCSAFLYASDFSRCCFAVNISGFCSFVSPLVLIVFWNLYVFT